MKTIQSLLDRVIYPLLVSLLTPVAVAVGSKIVTDDWTKWFRLIPKPAWVILGLVILLWVVIILIRKRLKRLEELNAGPAAIVTFFPRYGWMEVAKLNYAQVVWRVHAPTPFPWTAFEPSNIAPSSIEVATPPRCPNCETELEESRSFVVGYVWRCVRCGFKKRNRDSYYREAERAEKIARREWEVLYRAARSSRS